MNIKFALGTWIAIFMLAVVPSSVYALGSEMHFTADGTFSAKNVVVYQKAGSNLFCRGTWDTAFIRFVVVTSPSTSITKARGERAAVGEINEKDLINVEGVLATGGDSIVVNATSIEDTTLQIASKTLSGTIVSIDTGARTLTLKTKQLGTVIVSAGSAAITKGIRSITLGGITSGDKVLSAVGTYDYSTNTLAATAVEVYQDKSVFAPRNFEGKLKSISGVALPATFVVSVGGTDHTVYVGGTGIVLNAGKKAASLSRFMLGDTVRFYGTLRPANFTEVDAEVIRDLNF